MSDEEEQFRQFFRAATGFPPYAWQIKAAVEGLPQILPIPTGLGKTEGSTLAWAWRRFARKDDEPLHLVYCLPMRSLVRQTVERLRDCFSALKSWNGAIDIPVFQLIGGDVEEGWDALPDRPWVLVGTQDMLLSRALNRGYGMSRFDWPVHFGLLNQDCLWIVDEVQLMGPGLWTTAQLDWMRRHRFPGVKPCRTTWMSATLGGQFLQTTDRKRDGCDAVEPFDAGLESDSNEALKLLRAAWRRTTLHQPATGARAKPRAEQIASEAKSAHASGTLTLIVCNTVKTAQDIFQKLGADSAPKILLTSRFRAGDRTEYEKTLQIFEERRKMSQSGRVGGDDPGLICVSTQVIEAGLDISAHRLWTEHAPWPSLVQRLGRLNRDGKDNEARAVVWKLASEEKRKHEGEDWIGPYRKAALNQASSLLKVFALLSEQRSASEALAKLQEQMPKELAEALAIPPEPCPRALDVHGLFSTEPDVLGGFTDVSRFVRNADPDADITVFWRDWPDHAPPRGDALDGPPLDSNVETCAVALWRLQELMKSDKAPAWFWNDRAERWDRMAPSDLKPGMTVMLSGDVGGYDRSLGWTENKSHRLSDLPPPGSGRTLRDDWRAEAGYWSSLRSHLADARREAEQTSGELALQDPIRKAVIEASGLHDLGKAHPDWRGAIPKGGPLEQELLAKFPIVLRVEVLSHNAASVRAAVQPRLVGATTLPDEVAAGGENIRLRWALERPLDRKTLEEIRALPNVRWAAHKAFRPGLRHEAASALAMWRRYKDSEETPPYPALAVYLAAAHHGKVRTVLRAISGEGGDVFGVSRPPEALQFDGQDWPMDFSIALDGADGDWTDNGFALNGPGWTALVADLLGPWRGEADGAWTGAVPKDEPRALGAVCARLARSTCSSRRLARERAPVPARPAGRPLHMSANHAILSVIPVPGLNPTSLGAYLGALGLLKILSRRWPDVRAAWRDGVLHVVGGPTDRDTLADALMGFADQASWTPYERGWTAAQKASTKAKSGAKLAHWQARADENELELFAAHAAPASRIFFNPLLGSGGNAGKRAFADGWKKAADALKAPASPKKSKNATNADNRREALTAFLQGETLEWQAEKLNAASWFSDANKLYNSGQSAYSEGAISPWAMALACEGLAFFAGGASRRLGARTRPVGAFPFVVASAAPETSGEAGRDRGEVWTPLWNRPMTAPELAALFARGRAEIAGRGAVTPAAFAAAVTRRGVDAGVTEFRRFALGKTTSGNTFEPRYLGATQVPTAAAARSEAFERALNLIEKLPSDKKVGQRWRFVGLRGPIESALVRAAGAPADSEAAAALLDATVVSLDRVDVNRSFREQSVAWRPLPLAWLAGLFGGDAPDVEARLALSLASAFPADYPFALYRFGVEWRGRNRDGRPRKNSAYIHSKTPPARWVWRAGPLTRNLGAVLQRRLLDWENEHERGAPPAFARITARLSDIEAWLDENVDEALLARWLSRFALFDWSFDRNDARALLTLDNKWSPPTPVGPALALYGLLSPLFDLRPVRESGQRDGRDLLVPNTGARTPAAARKIAALIRGGDVERAVDVARSRYAMANAPLMSTDAPCAVNDPERLLTSLLFPVSSAVRAALVRRWLRPQRQSDEVTHA